MRIAGLAAVLVVASIFPAEAQRAANPFDGEWTVEVMDGRGSCAGEGRAVSTRVANGRLVYSGSQPVQVSGTVAANGTVNARITAQGDTLTARGRVQRTSGSGTWEIRSRGCTGRWVARRI